MECPSCGRPIQPRERWSWAGQWCSASCRRSMVREVRDVKPDREDWDPDSEPRVETGSLLVAVMEDDDLPLYF